MLEAELCSERAGPGMVDIAGKRSVDQGYTSIHQGTVFRRSREQNGRILLGERQPGSGDRRH